MKNKIQEKDRYSLSIQESANYFGIGEKRLYAIVRDNPEADYILAIGGHIRIKRKQFEKFLDGIATL